MKTPPNKYYAVFSETVTLTALVRGVHDRGVIRVTIDAGRALSVESYRVYEGGYVNIAFRSEKKKLTHLHVFNVSAAMCSMHLVEDDTLVKDWPRHAPSVG